MMSFRNLASPLLALALLCLPQLAAAEVFRCKNASGDTEFRDRPCTDASSQAARKNSRGAQCQSADGQRYPYGDERCVSTGPTGVDPVREKEKADADRYMRCASLRGKAEKLRDTGFTAFREVCADAPDSQQQERGPTGPRTRWVFRGYELELFTQGDRIVDVRQR